MKKHIPLSKADVKPAAKEPKVSAEEQRRIDEAKSSATKLLDRRSASWGAVNARWSRERETEATQARDAQKARRRQEKAGIANLKAQPVRGQAITGEKVIVDSVGGRFLLMMTRSGWPRELAEASARFERDYQLSRGGIRSQSLEPHVDGGRKGVNTSQMEAIAALRRIEASCDPEDWSAYVLWAGLGVTVTEMHKKHFGVKDELGKRLKRAASHAAAFYHSGFRIGASRTHRMMNEYIEELLG